MSDSNNNKFMGLRYIPRTTTFKQHVSSANAAWPQAQAFDQALLILAAVSFLLGCALLLTNGLQTGFYTAQALSFILPAIIWEHLSFMGDTLVVLTLALLFAYRYPHLLLALLITAIVGTLITHGIKPWLATPRPPGVLDPGSFQLIGSSISKKSMPSGHTLTAFAAAGLLTRLTTNRAIQGLILIVAVFIGWSRVAVGVHWPADVCMGAAGGLISAWAGLKLCDRWQDVFKGRFYAVLLTIHAGCAVTLINYDGGFPHTWLFAIAASAVSLGYIYHQLTFNHRLPKLKL
ncbi:phosphatase PAP2 family protein [Neptunomonas japonica]|uniref:phosphatase PAP2 family protein n=1 Tax=Neptunomonas japonica TaxID=417574 RepID=UPI0004278D9E|nr:phosphatase PAP2 family protein [Neptunomonas japonica]